MATVEKMKAVDFTIEEFREIIKRFTREELLELYEAASAAINERRNHEEI